MNAWSCMLSGFNTCSGSPFQVMPHLYVTNHNSMYRCIELLTAYNANINHSAAGGQTPLYLACKNGNKECIKLLLEAGTDRSIKTRVSTLLGECSPTYVIYIVSENQAYIYTIARIYLLYMHTYDRYRFFSLLLFPVESSIWLHCFRTVDNIISRMET